jgi:hypothetical protein
MVVLSPTVFTLSVATHVNVAGIGLVRGMFKVAPEHKDTESLVNVADDEGLTVT